MQHLCPSLKTNSNIRFGVSLILIHCITLQGPESSGKSVGKIHILANAKMDIVLYVGVKFLCFMRPPCAEGIKCWWLFSVFIVTNNASDTRYSSGRFSIRRMVSCYYYEI